MVGVGIGRRLLLRGRKLGFRASNSGEPPGRKVERRSMNWSFAATSMFG